ncbi:MAG: peptidase [Bacilli bacterium]|nr:peptidase [Bacilli bacterium]
MAYYIVALVVFLIDQCSKLLIVHNLKLYETHSVIGEFFQITSHRNRGAAFGILQDQRWFFITVTIIVVGGIVWYMRKVIKENKRLLGIALSLLLGGAVGNFLDRALHGEVVDFLAFHFQFTIFGHAVDYSFAIFNLADSAICIGVALICIDALLGWAKEGRGKNNESYGS